MIVSHALVAEASMLGLSPDRGLALIAWGRGGIETGRAIVPTTTITPVTPKGPAALRELKSAPAPTVPPAPVTGWEAIKDAHPRLFPKF